MLRTLSAIGLAAEKYVSPGHAKSNVKQMTFVCPRCRIAIDPPLQKADDPERESLLCAGCGFEWHVSSCKRQARREAQRRAWPDDPARQLLVSDKAMPRTIKAGVTMSMKEWVLWKLRHKQTVATLMMRSAIHQVIQQCTNLSSLYPEVPIGLISAEDVDRFWTDPEHKFLLLAIRDGMWDADTIANECEHAGQLTDDVIRAIVDTELPRVWWGGGFAGIVTYATWKPEINGLLLATTLLRAKDQQIPTLVAKLVGWLRDQGWNDYGRSRRRADV